MPNFQSLSNLMHHGSTRSNRSTNGSNSPRPSSTSRYPRESRDYNQSPPSPVPGSPGSIGWSPPTRSPPPPSPGSAYPQHGRSQQGNTTQWDGGFPQPDNGAQLGPNGYRPSSSVNNQPIAQTNSFSSSRSHHASPPVVRDECDEWFDSIDADRNGELSHEELHAALLNNNGGTLFSTTTVKYLVSIFDRDGDGVIRRDEFRPLWEYLADWRRMFNAFDTDRDGRIDAGELGGALAHYNIHLNHRTLDKLLRKHSKARRGHRPEMDLDQFVCACVVVRRMCQLYDSCNARGGSSISKDDFLQAVMALP